MAPSQLLTRLDMSDVENVKDAQAELHRAANDTAKLSVWAAKWGEALCIRCVEAEGAVEDAETVSDLEADLRDQEDRNVELRGTIRDAASAIDKFLDCETDALSDAHFKAVSKIGDDLEAAL